LEEKGNKKNPKTKKKITMKRMSTKPDIKIN
jgi:hypothetical protein